MAVPFAGRRRRRRGHLLALGVAGVLAPGVLAGTASATGTYPGETLGLAQDGAAVVGPAVNFEAVGQQTNVEDYARRV